MELDGNKDLALCSKMIKERVDILNLREGNIIKGQSNLSTILRVNNLLPVYLKGFALSQDDSIPSRIRFYEDIDLLIDPSQAPKYLEVLFLAGYKTKFDSKKISPMNVLINMGSLNLYHEVAKQEIDLHISPIWPYFKQVLNYDEVAKGSRAVSLTNNSLVNIPSISHHALILLIEGTKDVWIRIDKLLDFYLCFLSLKDVELEVFNRLVSENNLNKMLLLAKSLLDQIFTSKEGEKCPDWKVGQLVTCRILKSWESDLKKNVPIEPFRTAAHLCLIDSKLSYLVKRASLATENDLRIFTSLPNVPYFFLIVRPFRKLFSMGSRLISLCRNSLRVFYQGRLVPLSK